jgi:regulator of cell morphogenesis and NO signaling
VLFPYVLALEAAAAAHLAVPTPPFGTVANPVRRMRLEHDGAGAALRTLREASRGYAPPADGCGSYRALYGALEALEQDLHQHIHLENNILFPRAIALEEALARGPHSVA